jgi:hypothetical protein
LGLDRELPILMPMIYGDYYYNPTPKFCWQSLLYSHTACWPAGQPKAKTTLLPIAVRRQRKLRQLKPDLETS